MTTIRPALPEEIPLLAGAWYAMLDESGLLEPQLDPLWRESLERRFAAAMQGGEQRWLVVEADGRIAATGCAIFRAGSDVALMRPAATLAGIYTFPEYRRQGLARRLVTALIELCREAGCARIRLRASAAGRPLYESLGFVTSDEMRLDLA